MRSIVLITTLWLAGTAGAQSVKLAPPEQFKPLVEYSDTVATCDTMRALGPLREGETTIMIDFEKHQVLAENREKDTDRGLLLVFDDALRSEHIGSPLAMLDRLHRQCGAPALRE